MTRENLCCICESTANEKFYKQVNDYSLFHCQNCDFHFLKNVRSVNSQFIEDVTSNDNEEMEYWSFPNLFEKHKSIFEGFFDQRLQRLTKFCTSKNWKVLDVGAGYGFWTEYLKNKGHTVSGIDISKETLSYTKKEKLDYIRDCSYEHFQSEDTFDQIHMFDVLEHFENPRQMLAKTKKYLNNDGLLYIQVPNVIGFKYPYKHSLGLPHHIWQFSPQSLAKLLDSCGYEVLEYWTGIQGVIGRYEEENVTFLTKLAWWLANKIKRGNRVQVIARVK